MNADAYMLLANVLEDRPCIDSSLQTAIDTTPFAINSIVQQCYYVLHLISVTRALLYDDQSAYAQTVQRLVDKLPEDSSEDPVHPPLPSARERDVPLLSASNGDGEQMLSREHLKKVVNAPFKITSPLFSSSDVFLPAKTASETHPESHLCGVPTTSLPVSHSPLLPVVPARSLDVSVTIVGGGTVAKALLHFLLDQHPSLLHPTRVTVITRQPEKLNLFASRGVLCLNRKHGTKALNSCHALILACQPGAQLEDFVENHFNCKAYGNSPLHRVARLKSSTIVVSCLAAYPISKLAAQLRHDERLIIRTHVASITALPEVGEEYVSMTRDTTALFIQKIADEDSFLKKAVQEAAQHRIEIAVERILGAQYREKGSTSDSVEDVQKIPEDLARRAAFYAAEKEERMRMKPVDPLQVLISNMNTVNDEFLVTVWAAIQTYVRIEFEVRETEKARRVQALKVLGQGEEITRSPSEGGRSFRRTISQDMSIVKRREGKAEAQSAAKQSEGPFLCAALAMLPSSVHAAVVDHLVFGYCPPNANEKLFLTEKESTERSGRLSSAVSFARNEEIGVSGQRNLVDTICVVLSRLPSLYLDEHAFTNDLRSQYAEVIKAEIGAELEKII